MIVFDSALSKTAQVTQTSDLALKESLGLLNI